MATRDELLGLLERLVLAYPERELTLATAGVYLEELSDIPIRWLRRAARRWISTQPWFPKVSDLRQTARHLAGVTDFASLEEHEDLLMTRYHRLCQRFWKELQVDEQDWLDLAADFEAAEHPHMAERPLPRVKAFQKELAELVEQGEEDQLEAETGSGGDG